LVHFLGSDAHCPQKRPPLWPAALARLEKLAGREAVLPLTLHNPKDLLAGSEVAASPGPTALSGRGVNLWERVLGRILGSIVK